mmetsp:Transcript_48041/g.148257  ORF Transcript_48041/g.148257 Transcript_48041/m.148257 type:complete len:204 (-) Transcript_48041:388-999(-)
MQQQPEVPPRAARRAVEQPQQRQLVKRGPDVVLRVVELLGDLRLRHLFEPRLDQNIRAQVVVWVPQLPSVVLAGERRVLARDRHDAEDRKRKGGDREWHQPLNPEHGAQNDRRDLHQGVDPRQNGAEDVGHVATRQIHFALRAGKPVLAQHDGQRQREQELCDELVQEDTDVKLAYSVRGAVVAAGRTEERRLAVGGERPGIV